MRHPSEPATRNGSRSLKGALAAALLLLVLFEPAATPDEKEPVLTEIMSATAPDSAVGSPGRETATRGCQHHAAKAFTPTAPDLTSSESGGAERPKRPRPASQIAFASDRSGDWEIYVSDLDGSNLRQVTNSPGIDREPNWSPDGNQIVFVKLASQTDYTGDIYIINADGAGMRKLTSGGEPSWSPDGQRIAYFSTQFEPLSPSVMGSVWIINSDGSGNRLLGKDLGDPTWMPDGQTMFAGGISSENPTINVYRVRSDGTAQTRLTNDGGFACSPSAAPDGSGVAFVNLGGTESFHISIMRPDGSDQRAITRGPAWDSFPSWSADARRIVFSRDSDADPHWSLPFIGGGPLPSSLWIVNADGSGLTQLTNNPFNDADPAFRPPAVRGSKGR